MAAVEMIALDEILALPDLYIRSVDEGHVGRLGESLAEGEAFAPLLVARPADPIPEWWGCPNHHRQAERAAWLAKERQTPWANLPIQASVVLVDGVHRFWAARAAGLKSVPVQVIDQPVATQAEVVARSLAANLRNPLPLSDDDIRGAFERLWLGRPALASHERWQPEAGALPLTRIAEVLGRSASWCSAMQAYSRVRYALGLDLGLARSREIARLDERQWRAVVFEADGLRLHAVVDPAGLRPATMRTVPEMRVREVEALVSRWLGQAAAPAPAAALVEPEGGGLGEPCAATEADAAAEVSGPAVQLELPLDLDDLIRPSLDWYRAWRPRVRQLTAEQARDFCVHTAPLLIEVSAAYEQAQRIARRAGYEV